VVTSPRWKRPVLGWVPSFFEFFCVGPLPAYGCSFTFQPNTSLPPPPWVGAALSLMQVATLRYVSSVPQPRKALSYTLFFPPGLKPAYCFFPQGGHSSLHFLLALLRKFAATKFGPPPFLPVLVDIVPFTYPPFTGHSRGIAQCRD